MQVPESLQSAIADFPGYGDDLARERSDEFVRSYVGERLADLQQRLQPLDATLNDRFGALLLRTAFVNQVAYKLYERDDHSPIDVGPVAAADASAVQLAGRASSLDAAQVPQYLDEVTHALDERDTAMSGARTAPSTT